MKTVGIIGGLSPESTISYYRGLNEGVRVRQGGHHNAKIMLNSLDFGEFVALKEKGDWASQSRLLCGAAQSLEKAGADFVILATNTMHKMADDIVNVLSVPFLHLADATAQKIKQDGVSCVSLLGTRYTMELDFYKSRLERQGIKVLVPDEPDRTYVHDIIYDELCRGIVDADSEAKYYDLIATLSQLGAEGVILGCTEIGMLVDSAKLSVPCYDTTQIHIESALDYMFEGD